MTIRENRKLIPIPKGMTEEDLAASRLEAFVDGTQSASEVLAHRIRKFREHGGLTERQLAQSMTEQGVPLTGDKVSKIERGSRRVQVEELLAFAFALDVPLSRLLSPSEGESHMRAGGIALDRAEVGNWMVWGPPYSELASNSTHALRLARQIATTMQILEEERDPDEREKFRKEMLAAITDLRKTLRIRPGVLRRREVLAATDEVLQRDDPLEDETR